jgi:hypothetical protein
MENRLAMGVDSLPMVEEAFQSIEAMEKFCVKILDSKLVPDHFYPKKEGNDRERDYSKGNTAAVMMVLIQGKQFGLPVMTSLQHIVPVNGLMSVKGDAAKAMIFASGKLTKDSWKETVTGTIENQDMMVTITASRNDTGETLTRSFSVEMAKRAGLWVTEEMTRKPDGYKHIAKTWWKHPQRMITYRVLGFLARDLFPDVMNGIPTTEEARDYPEDTEIIIEANDAQIRLPDPDHTQQRSKQLTGKANLQIDKRSGDLEPKPKDLEKYPKAVGESYPVPDEKAKPDPDPQPDPQPEPEPEPEPEVKDGTIATMLNGTPGTIKVCTEKYLMELETEDLHALIECDGLMTKARDIDPGKNTNKKLRLIILAHYAGNVVSLIEKFDPEDGREPAKPSQEEDPPLKNQEGEKISGSEEVPGETPAVDPDEIQVEAAGDQDPEPDPDPEPEESISPNKGFDAGASDTQPEAGEDTNKFNIDVPELVDGKRGFEQVKTLFEEMASQAGIDNNSFDSLIQTKFPQFQKYRVKEDFCYKAPAADINLLLNSI